MRDILALSLPLTVWLIGFCGLYGLQGLICAASWGDLAGPGGVAWGRILLLAGLGVALLVQGGALGLVMALRPRLTAGVMRQASGALAVVGLMAMIWTALPLALLPLCAGERAPERARLAQIGAQIGIDRTPEGPSSVPISGSASAGPSSPMVGSRSGS